MAETLFEEGKRRMQANDYAGACPKLAESYRLDPGSGTLTALALCHEKLGKTATAWAEFIEVVTEAQQGGRSDREKFARQHVSALEPHLSRLTINVAPETARLPDVQLRRDKVVVGSAAWGVASPVDPGEHLIEVSAPGHEPWGARVTVGDNADKQSISVPPLHEQADETAGPPAPPMIESPAPEPKETPATPPDNQAPNDGSRQRIAGWVVGGLGLASIGVGSYFGVQAISNSNNAKNTCTSGNSGCSSQGLTMNDQAKTDAHVADATIGAGIVAIGVGIYLLASAPSAPAPTPAPPETQPSAIRVIPTFGRQAAGIAVQGAW